MPKAFLATVHILLPLDIKDDAEAADAISGLLTEGGIYEDAILDWCYASDGEGFPPSEQIEIEDPFDRDNDETASHALKTGKAKLAMLSALEAFEDEFSCLIEGDEDMGGADAVDAVCRLWPKVKAALEAIQGKATDYKTSMATCDACGAEVSEIIGCPDGREVCRHCFENGEG